MSVKMFPVRSPIVFGKSKKKPRPVRRSRLSHIPRGNVYQRSDLLRPKREFVESCKNLVLEHQLVRPQVLEG